MMSNGSRQMRLAEADPTVNKKRVIFLARPPGDCHGGGVGELVARSDYEFCKGEPRIHLGVECATLGLVCAVARRDGPVRNSFRRPIVTVAAAVPVRSFALLPSFAHNEADLD